VSELTGPAARLPKLRRQMEALDITALLVTDILNIRYLTGFTGSTAQVVVTPTQAAIFVDSRYYLQAEQQAPLYELVKIVSPKRWHEVVAEYLQSLSLERVHFEASLSYAAYEDLTRALTAGAEGGITLCPTRDVVEGMRLVKDADEIARIRAAAALTDECCEFGLSLLRPGIRERDVAVEMECYLRRHGAEQEAFATIVASGPLAASPHARATEKEIAAGDLVMIDFGVMREQYTADITRTVVVGRADSRQREIYAVVLEAQEAAIAAIRPGRQGREIDQVARDYIAARGFGEYFGHGLGHSIGLHVHDGAGFSPSSTVVLEPGMVITVEPGIYLPGWGGIRIEDDILVTADGAEVLTRTPKAFRVVG
jgi:Xaa-Pro aminopeptidase